MAKKAGRSSTGRVIEGIIGLALIYFPEPATTGAGIILVIDSFARRSKL